MGDTQPKWFVCQAGAQEGEGWRGVTSYMVRADIGNYLEFVDTGGLKHVIPPGWELHQEATQ